MFRIGLLLSLLVASFSGAAWAESEEDVVKAAIKKMVPTMEPDSVVPSELPGFYVVTYGADIFYVSKDGRYLMYGDVINLDSKKNITEAMRSAGRLSIIESVDESTMISYSPKEVKHHVKIFTDIDCGYCRRMHSQMAEYNDLGIKISYLAFPRSGKDTKSYHKAVSVWCDDNQADAMTEAKGGATPAKKTCDNPVDEHMEVARQVGVTGTPTMVLSDGSVVPGYVPAEQLLRRLEEGN